MEGQLSYNIKVSQQWNLKIDKAHNYNKDVAPHKHTSDFGHMAIIRAKESYEEKENRL